MRAPLLFSLLLAAPALAQQGPIDPDLIGTWTLDVIEGADVSPDVEVEFASVTFTADGRLIGEATATLDGERTSRTEERAYWAVDGFIHTPDTPPVPYAFVGPDDLRMSIGGGVALRFRRTGL